MGKQSQKALEQRRLRGGRLLRQGWLKIEVARELGVSPTTVTRWAETLETQGLRGLRTQRARGRPAGLDPRQLKQLLRELKRGAMAHGFATELWTLPRITALIEQRFGRRYSEPHVWRLLQRLGWSCQRPTGRATQRDEDTITEWKHKRWPALKKTPKNAAKT